jgi:hypothetical protein
MYLGTAISDLDLLRRHDNDFAVAPDDDRLAERLVAPARAAISRGSPELSNISQASAIGEYREKKFASPRS